MPAQPTNLASALEQALACVLNRGEFQTAINEHVTAREQIEVLSIGTLSEITEDQVGVEVDLRDEYSGRIETYRVQVTADRAVSLMAVPQAA